MRLQVCGWRTVWGAAIDSTQQQQQQRQHRKQIVTLVVVVRDSKQQQRGSTGARGCYYQVWAREALAGPEGWRKCGAVERCVWRVGPRDALARACCPGYASSSSANSPSTPRPHTSMRGARRLQASSSSLGRLRWGTNAAAQTSIAPLQPAAPGPTFALWQGRRRELTSGSASLPIDTGEEPFTRTGGTSGSSHTYSPRESCAYARRVSLFVVCQLPLPALISCCLCCPSLPCARVAPSVPPFRLLTASFLKRWQHFVIPSR
jgi:hypothetical protein